MILKLTLEGPIVEAEVVDVVRNAGSALRGGTRGRRALIQAAVERIPSGVVVRIATDSDEEGARFATIIEAVTVEAGKSELAVERVIPP